jgi:peptidoglycan hydrolase CwlO-like protein
MIPGSTETAFIGYFYWRLVAKDAEISDLTKQLANAQVRIRALEKQVEEPENQK